jgi:uncharacterized membrane protein YccC
VSSDDLEGSARSVHPRTTAPGRTSTSSSFISASRGRCLTEIVAVTYARAVADLATLKSAARAAIVIPAVFALTDKVITQPQTSLFAAFGSFAMLVLTDFGGPRRTRLLAYLGLACAGATFIILGTLGSHNEWLGATAMAVTAFLTLFAGVISGFFAAGATGALLTFVLPVTIPAPNSAIPDRLEGWGIAVGAGLCALMLLWPPRWRKDLQRDAAAALRAVADLLDSDREQWDERARIARASVDALGRRLLGTQHRPTGPTGPTAALASLPDELDWLLSFLTGSLEPTRAEDAEAISAAATALGMTADRLAGHGAGPDFAGLDTTQDAVEQALAQRLLELPTGTPEGNVPRQLDTPLRIRAVTSAARQAADYALRAAGAEAPELERDDAAHHARKVGALEGTGRLTVEHANVRSVWLRNSVRGAVGLAAAVFIAQRTGLQHGFWVVLGTLSVLRSNALGTGWSIISALAGTAAGIIVGALLLIGIGTHETVLWIVLPFAVLLAGYAPRAISFAAGQAAFTVVLFLLFNIIQPVGWRVGLVRVEDVAIGFAISLGVGLLFWPRGAGALLRKDLAAAYSRAADYVVATAQQLSAAGDSDDVGRTARAADIALHRLEDAFREYLAERSATRFNLEDVGALVGGAVRVRRAAQSLRSLEHMANGRRLEHCAENLNRELDALHSWYVALGYALVNSRPAPPPHIRDAEGRRRLLACVREAARGADKATVTAALVLLLASQHLDNLWRLEAHLRERANAARATSTNGAESGRPRWPALATRLAR